ncbi:MAG: 6-bladed beta-propeller [Acidobacteriia bacterium]|nr:6-bladed beta-propeller [Terriglobia bacterium]
MFTVCSNSIRRGKAAVTLIILLALALASPVSLYAKKKKVAPEKPKQPDRRAMLAKIDTSKLVWPSPPNIARIRYMNYYAGMKIDYSRDTKKPKQSWMDRLAGTETKGQRQIEKDFPFQLLGPYGIAIDSKGLVYVADQKVGAIFIFNTETRDVQLIRNGYEAHFGLVNGVAVDDDDRLFVSDGKFHKVLVFNPKHEVENQITEGLVDPVGLAIDTENRILYVVDTQQDQVIVYDADSLRLLRRIGTGGKTHYLTTPGDFAAPSNVALDQDGNVYVTDTLNNRVEIFDAEGKFIREFGKHCDGPGCFARPKGIAIDSDGHVWVADAYLDAVQVFTQDGELMGYMGGHGDLPGQFAALMGIAVDKQNRVFTTEQYPGRMQMFRYITDAEAAAEKARREVEQKKKADSTTGKKVEAQANVQEPARQ